MDGRKVTRFKFDNGEWRSKVYILNPDTNKYEEEVKQEPKQQPQTGMNPDSVWSKPKYDTDRFESYIHYLLGIERDNYKSNENKVLFNQKINVSWG